MSKSRRSMRIAAVAAATAVLAVPAVLFAWGEVGHRITGEAAALRLPAAMPAFFRAASKQLAYLNPEPDRWRSRSESAIDPALDRATAPDHFIDMELVPPSVLKQALRAPDRFAYLARAALPQLPLGAVQEGAERTPQPLFLVDLDERSADRVDVEDVDAHQPRPKVATALRPADLGTDRVPVAAAEELVDTGAGDVDELVQAAFERRVGVEHEQQARLAGDQVDDQQPTEVRARQVAERYQPVVGAVGAHLGEERFEGGDFTRPDRRTDGQCHLMGHA